MSKFPITLPLAQKLIAEQFPQWENLLIREVLFSGWDNKTFRLGDEMLIRMPSAEAYADKVHKEQKWLPIMAPHITLQISEPLALGHPSEDYPFPWSIYKWIPGNSANSLALTNIHLKNIAVQLAAFLNELHIIDTKDAPEPGVHNFFRGAHPCVYNDETLAAISNLKDVIDVTAVTSLWNKALESKWTGPHLWIHGDLSAGNIIIKDDELTAVIDFGGCGIGDPACDLVIAWTLFEGESRVIFKSLVDLDSDTWARARGWALWKALITLDSLDDKESTEAHSNFRILTDLLGEYQPEKG